MIQIWGYHTESVIITEQMAERIYLKLLEVWSPNTCYPPIKDEWTEKNPSFGQCAATAAAICMIYGGNLAFSKEGYHYWNILPDGSQHDFTRAQFTSGELERIEQVATKTIGDITIGERAEAVKTMERAKIIFDALTK